MGLVVDALRENKLILNRCQTVSIFQQMFCPVNHQAKGELQASFIHTGKTSEKEHAPRCAAVLGGHESF